MAQSTTALSTPNTPLRASATVSVANPNRDGTGTKALIFTSPVSGNGSRVDAILIHALNTTTDGMVRLFVNNSLIGEVQVTATTPSGTTPAFSTVFYPCANWSGPLYLQIGDELRATTQNAESFMVTALGWLY